ncbi:MAG: hypothetical protein VZQ84_00465 [Anaerovoracaceae bacterium]|nr:hypothetical protein [Anaerovoracaceae bacterium]
MERRVDVRNGFTVQQAEAENKITAKQRLNSGAFISFLGALLAALGASVVAAPAAVSAYIVMAIVCAFSFEGFVDAEIRNAVKHEK